MADRTPKNTNTALKIFTGVLLILSGIIYYMKDFVYAFFIEIGNTIDVAKLLAVVPILVGAFCIYKFFSTHNRLILPVGIFLLYYGIIQMLFSDAACHAKMLTSTIFIVPSLTMLIFNKYSKTPLYVHLGVFLLVIGIGLILQCFFDIPYVTDGIFYCGIAFALLSITMRPKGKAMLILGLFLMFFSLKGLLSIDGVANAAISVLLILAGLYVIINTSLENKKMR